MDINKLVHNTIRQVNAGGGEKEEKDLYKLVYSEILTDDILTSIYERWKNDLDLYIDNYARNSGDTNAEKGMYKCSLETWQACACDIGREYFLNNKYLFDINKMRKQGGGRLYRDELLLLGLELYEYYCTKYRKQFFIYDCTRFLGLGKDLLYKLNDLHGGLLKRAHTSQEASMRSALASGRSNVTAMAILLNHDYNYTRTTEIVHTTNSIKSADTLPVLSNNEITLNLPEKNIENM